jgi:hypothetical protein
MNTRVIWVLLIIATHICNAQHTGHPRLLFSASDTTAIRLKTEVSDARLLYLEVKEQADYLLTHDRYIWTQAIEGAYFSNIVSLCFVYLVEHKTTYSDRAKELIFGGPTSPPGFIDDWGAPGSMAPYHIRLVWQKIIALSLCYDMLFEQLSEQQRSRMRDTIISDLNFAYHPTTGIQDYWGPREWFTRRPGVNMEHNYSVLPAIALILGPMAVYGESSNYPTTLADADIQLGAYHLFMSDSSWMKRSWSSLDGDYTEGISYGFWGTMDFPTPLRALGRWNSIDYFQIPEVRDRLSKCADWFAYEVSVAPRWPAVNRGMFNALNDGNTLQFGALGLALDLSTHYGDKAGLFRWVFNNTVGSIGNLLLDTSPNQMQGIHGNPVPWIISILDYDHDISPIEPSSALPLGKHFRKAGLVYLRSSSTWANGDDIQLAFSCSPAWDKLETGLFSNKHQHQDINQITLSAYGTNYLVGINDAPSSLFHNVVLIDGAGEAYSNGFPTGTTGWLNDGNIVQYHGTHQYEFIHGDATSAYNEIHYGDFNDLTKSGKHVIMRHDSTPRPPNPVFNPVDRAHRYLLFSRNSVENPLFFERVHAG